MKRTSTLMPKLSLGLAFMLFASLAANAQGWVGDGTNKLYPVNNGLSLSPLSIGIGTSAPSEQFHTTGSVRFQGLTQSDTTVRIITQDANGKLYWRSAGSISAGGGWSLTGNAGTNPSSNFLGTTDYQRLVFKTANTERATILSNGNVGINTANPIKLLQVHNPSGEDNNIYVSGGSPSIYFSQSATFPPAPYSIPTARIALATRTSAHLTTAKAGDMVLFAATPGAGILFGAGVDPSNNGTERVRISADGNLGINTTAPTARLHANGTVRFQNLPSGSGDALVIDASGNVYRGSVSGGGGADTALAALQQEVSDLKAVIAVMQQQIAELKAGAVNISPSGVINTRLNVAPNPTGSVTRISYTYPSTVKKAYLNISDLNGRVIKKIDLTGNNESTVTVGTDAFNRAGTYISSLELDGKISESKKVVVTQ